MPRYRWTSGRPLVRTGADNVEQGEEFTADEAVGRSFSDFLEPIDEDAEETIPEDAAGDIDELLDGTVEEVRDALESGDYDGRLDELEAREADGQDRNGVYNAIDDRREA